MKRCFQCMALGLMGWVSSSLGNAQVTGFQQGFNPYTGTFHR